MTIKLERKWVDYLIRQPESGMGFQKVDVRLKGNRVLHDIPVFNAEEIMEEKARGFVENGAEVHSRPS